ncbi:MAG TPA: SRPBCC family protein [Gemmatimonadales bacterium]|nr:SRPBCC family protein [Gemmatimonadales bacterium]
MRIALIVIGVVVGLVAIVALIGALLPVKHQVTREATFKISPDKLFALISSPMDFPRWRTGVKSVEMLPSGGGLPKWTEVSSDGTITYAVTQSVAGVQLVTTIADRSLPFGGSWTYVLAPAGSDSTTLRITEDGEVYNVIFRFMSRFVFGHTSGIERYLKDVQQRA